MTTNGSYSYVPYTFTTTTTPSWVGLTDTLWQLDRHSTYSTEYSDCSGFISSIIDKMNGVPLYNSSRLTENIEVSDELRDFILDGYATWRRAADDLNAKIEFSKGNSLEVSDELRDFIDELGGE